MPYNQITRDKAKTLIALEKDVYVMNTITLKPQKAKFEDVYKRSLTYFEKVK